jgi:hypothetical protein
MHGPAVLKNLGMPSSIYHRVCFRSAQHSETALASPWDMPRACRRRVRRSGRRPGALRDDEVADPVQADGEDAGFFLQVVIPVGGMGATVTLRGGLMGIAPAGVEAPSRKRQSTRPLGRAALGAIRPRQPSLNSVSPISWKGGHVWRFGFGGESPTFLRRSRL